MNFVDWNYLYWPRSPMADKWLLPLAGLREFGVELGASAHNSFGIPSINVDYTREITTWKESEAKICGCARWVDVVAMVDDLPFLDSSFRFLLNSHVFEHQANPIKCLLEWWRVVEPDGIIYSVIPCRDTTPADASKPLTTLEHQIEDYRIGHTPETHPIDGDFDEKWGHIHRYDIESYKSLIKLVNDMFDGILQIVDVAEKDDKVGNGFTVVHKVIK